MILLLLYFIEISEFNANSVDPDQTPRSVASDLGLHCLPMSILWDARQKWVRPPVVYLLTVPRRSLCSSSFFLCRLLHEHIKRVQKRVNLKSNAEGFVVNRSKAVFLLYSLVVLSFILNAALF